MSSMVLSGIEKKKSNVFNRKKNTIKTLQQKLNDSQEVEANLRQALTLIPLDLMAMGDLWLPNENTIITIKNLTDKTGCGENI